MAKFKSFEEFAKSLKPFPDPKRGSYKAFILPNKQILFRFIKRNNYKVIHVRNNI